MRWPRWSGSPGRRLGLAAAVVLVPVLAAAAVGAGAWVAITRNPDLPGRPTALTGVDACALLAVAAGVGLAAWPRRAHRGRRRPARRLARATLPAADIPGPLPGNGHSVVGVIPREPPGYLPRADLLAELDRAGGRVSVLHAVAGMPGVGTTQLAAACARARLAAGWRLVAWVNATDPGALRAGLAVVARALGLADGSTGLDGSDPGQAVRRRLEADGDRCLLVFDNVVDPDGIRPFLPVCGSAQVLITSSRPSAAGLGACVPVDVFSADEALAFLAGRTGLTDTAGASALARELGHLPLALAQAAATIAAQRLAYGTYLDRLRALPVIECLTQEEGPSCPQGVAKAVVLSLDTVLAGDRAGVCAGVMEITAVLSAAGVRGGLLRDAGRAGVLATGGDRAEVPGDRVDGAVAELAYRSLLTFSLDGQTVVVHCLIMRVMQDVLARRARIAAACRDAARVLLERAKALKGSPDRPAVMDFAEQVAALQETAAAADEADGELAAAMLRLRSWALYYLTVLGGSGEQAASAGEPVAADLALMLGADHPDALASRNNLAVAYQQAGRTAEAAALFDQVLAGREQVLGADHPDTLTSRSNLAVAYSEAGRAAEAAALFEQVLAGRERVLGADHPDTLASRSNLAVAYQQVGWSAEAVPLFEQALAGRERVLGADHPDTLASRSNLAVAYQQVGWSAEAAALFEQVLAGRERVLGGGHPDTLASRTNLGYAYREAGRFGEAIALFEQSLATSAWTLGPDHPRTLISRGNLAGAYRDAGL
jgi:tetratricopeptide (TPR) repeat protein